MCIRDRPLAVMAVRHGERTFRSFSTTADIPVRYYNYKCTFYSVVVTNIRTENQKATLKRVFLDNKNLLNVQNNIAIVRAFICSLSSCFLIKLSKLLIINTFTAASPHIVNEDRLFRLQLKHTKIVLLESAPTSCLNLDTKYAILDMLLPANLLAILRKI